MKWVYSAVFILILAVAGLGSWFVWGQDTEPTVLTVLAGPRDSDANKLMREIGEVAERYSDTVRLRVLSSANSTENINRMRNGEGQLATIQAGTPAYNDIKLIADLFADHFILIVHAKAPIYRVADLVGQRIAIPEDGSRDTLSFWSVIDHYALPPERLRTFSVPQSKGFDLFLTNQVSAVFVVASLRDPALLAFIEETQLRGQDIRFIPIDQAKAMTLKRPHIEPATIVAGAFSGAGPVPVRDVPTASMHRLLVAHESADEAAINELARIIFENRLDLLIRMPLSSNITGPNALEGASLPFHAGAQRYYDRDKPSFLQENAEPLALIVTVLAMIVSALLALRRSLTNRAKNRADSYNHRILDISRRASATNDLKELDALDAEMREVLETVVNALDVDEVTEEGFQSFSFLWSTVRDEIHERRQELAA